MATDIPKLVKPDFAANTFQNRRALQFRLMLWLGTFLQIAPTP